MKYCLLVFVAVSPLLPADPVTVTGHVFDQAGAPLAYAEVRAVRVMTLGEGNPEDPLPVETERVTDAEGAWTLTIDDNLQGLESVVFFAVSGGYRSKLWRNVEFSGGAPIRGLLDDPGFEALDIRAGAAGIDFHLTPSVAKTTHMVAMRDGIRLATDVYLPGDGEGPWPVVVYRTPYNKNPDNNSILTRHGYVAVSQDVRGKFESEGETQVFLCDGWGDLQDGYDTCAWILAQPWCNGKLGSMGGSARGITQNMLRGAVPPGLICQYVSVGASNLYTQAVFQGGGFRESMAECWLNGQDATHFLEQAVAHPDYDAFWSYGNADSRAHVANVAVVSRGGWYDIFLQGTINNFVLHQRNGVPGAHGRQKLIIGPWCHGGQGEIIYPPNSERPPVTYYGGVSWLDHHLKGIENGVMEEAAVCYYLMGAVGEADAPGNEWRLSETWPVPTRPLELYLNKDGLLSEGMPAEEEAFSTYTYDPADPVPTIGGANLCLEKGPYDQRPAESRADVLVFRTPPLERPLTIAGKVRVKLHVSSTALDTDFTAKLTDIYPDGRSMLVCDGIIRMRHRDGMESQELMVPGEIYTAEVDLWETAIVFNRGHRVGVAIASSNHPRFQANTNTGEPFGLETGTATAQNTVYFDRQWPSRISFRVPISGFIRGDGNGDGIVDLSDPIALLMHLFSDGFDIDCKDAADANDDGALDIADAIKVLGDLFGQGIAQDFGDCEADATPDLLDCATYPACPDADP